MSAVFFIVSLLVLSISAWYDLSKERVPNVFVLPCILAGLVIQPFRIPLPDYLIRLGIICGIYFLYEGFIGAGDAKLVMMLTILCGPIRGLGSLGVIVFSLVRSPSETRQILVRNWTAFRAMNISSLKGNGPGVALAPFLLISFVLLTLISGI